MSPGPLIKPCSYTAPLISPDVREKLDIERSKIGKYKKKIIILIFEVELL